MLAVAVCFAQIGLWMKVWQHHGCGMNRDVGLSQQGCLVVLEGLESEVEHVSESTYVYHRGLGSSVGLYISTHHLFFLICQLLFCLLTGSLAAACGMGKGTCQNYALHLSSSTSQQMENAGKCGLCVSDILFWKLCLHTQLWHVSLNLGNEICTVGQSNRGHKVDLCCQASVFRHTSGWVCWFYCKPLLIFKKFTDYFAIIACLQWNWS